MSSHDMGTRGYDRYVSKSGGETRMREKTNGVLESKIKGRGSGKGRGVMLKTGQRRALEKEKESAGLGTTGNVNR